MRINSLINGLIDIISKSVTISINTSLLKMAIKYIKSNYVPADRCLD